MLKELKFGVFVKKNLGREREREREWGGGGEGERGGGRERGERERERERETDGLVGPVSEYCAWVRLKL